MKTRKSKLKKLKKDFIIVLISIGIALILFKLNAFGIFLTYIKGYGWLASIGAGFFFTSVFTAAPATVLLIEIMQKEPILLTAFLGAAGASLADFIVFHIIKDKLADDVEYLIECVQGGKKFLHVFCRRSFRWLVPLLGAIIIATPFPNEMALSMMGLSKTKNSVFLLIVFSLQFLGLLALGFAVRGLTI